MKFCKYYPLIQKYFSEQLTIGETTVLKKHMDQCTTCKEEYDFLNSFLENLKDIDEREKKVEPSVNFTDKTLARLPELSIKPEATKAPFLYFPTWKWATAVAVVIVLFASILVVNLSSPKTVTVSFEIFQPEAHTVSLAGDFNNWNFENTQLIKHGEFWRVTLELEPGQYQYMFVIDGTEWKPDPKAEEYIDDGYGYKNAILDLL